MFGCIAKYIRATLIRRKRESKAFSFVLVSSLGFLDVPSSTNTVFPNFSVLDCLISEGVLTLDSCFCFVTMRGTFSLDLREMDSFF